MLARSDLQSLAVVAHRGRFVAYYRVSTAKQGFALALCKKHKATLVIARLSAGPQRPLHQRLDGSQSEIRRLRYAGGDALHAAHLRRRKKMGPSGALKSRFRGHSGIFTITDKLCRWRYAAVFVNL